MAIIFDISLITNNEVYFKSSVQLINFCVSFQSTEGQDKFLPLGLAVHHRTGIVMVVDRNSNDIQVVKS